MDEDGNRTLDGLERDAERDRAELAGTVEALRGRIAPSGGGVGAQLSAGARAYAVDGVLRRVEDHPLQTVAIAAGVAYPVVRIVTKIPAPILLLGAGVALAGRGGRGPDERVEVVVASRAEADAAPTEETGFRQPKVSAVGASGTTPSSTPGAVARARANADRRMADVGERAVAAGRAGGERTIEAIRRNPAMAGGASLLIGAALAAMLPRTRAEERAFGEAAEDVREKARAAAAEGIEAGRRVLGAAAEEAERQNLTVEDAKGVVRDVAERARETIRDAGDEARGAVQGSQDDGSEGKPG